MDQEAIRPVRKKLKEKRSKLKLVLLTIFSMIIFLATSYGGYWYGSNGEEDSNEFLIIQGRQEAYDFITNLRLNCQTLIINHTNQDNESILLSYIPVEGCLSDNQINCILGDIQNEYE